jgi:hypothetical protein
VLTLIEKHRPLLKEDKRAEKSLLPWAFPDIFFSLSDGVVKICCVKLSSLPALASAKACLKTRRSTKLLEGVCVWFDDKLPHTSGAEFCISVLTDLIAATFCRKNG